MTLARRSYNTLRAGRASIRPRRADFNGLHLNISEEVLDAVNTRRPVVALESTIYTHGFPYPENVQLALRLEDAARAHGAVPATIGIIDGVAHVGMSKAQLEVLTSSVGPGSVPPMKISTRDLGYICGKTLRGRQGQGSMGQKLNGGTTIAATMVLAYLAKISVFATGGLGGVHRGGENSLDISADLTELGRTQVAVVSSGCKGFLDIPRTLEVLETQGVGVATFADGRDPAAAIDYPAFWSRDSGTRSPMVVEDERQAAAMIHAQHRLVKGVGLHFANPIPVEHAIPKSEMDLAISQALKDADDQGIVGKVNTPFVLDRIRDLTGGKSVAVNAELVTANVIRGAKIAVELGNIFVDERRYGEESRSQRTSNARSNDAKEDAGHKRNSKAVKIATDGLPPPFSLGAKYTDGAATTTTTATNDKGHVDILVAGSLAIDIACDSAPSTSPPAESTPTPQLHTSNPATISQTIGGVGYNITRAAHLVGASTRLCTAVADDLSGRAAVSTMKQQDLATSQVDVIDGTAATAQYIAVNDTKKDLVVAMADMGILESSTSASKFDTKWLPALKDASPRYLAIDTNWDKATLHKWISSAKSLGIEVALEPVSVAKSKRLFERSSADHVSIGVFPNHHISLCTPNVHELAAMNDEARDTDHFERADWWTVLDALGISSGGAREMLVAVTNASLVDRGIPQRAIQLLPFIPCLLTKLGDEGVLLTQLLKKGDARLSSPDTAKYIISRSSNENEGVGGVYMRWFPPQEVVDADTVVSVNGVGDTFLGILLAGLCRDNHPDVEDLVDLAQRGCRMTLQSSESVHPGLSQLKALL